MSYGFFQMRYLTAFAHLQWLYFLAWSPVVYLTGPGFYGAVIPAFLSLLLTVYLWKTGHTLLPSTGLIVCLMETLCILTGISFLSYWGNTGLHIFPLSEILWPLLMVALSQKDLHFLWTYPLSFASTLFVDVFQAGVHMHWTPGFWFGVGGAGFQDGVFMTPLTTLALSTATLLVVRQIRTHYGVLLPEPVPRLLPIPQTHTYPLGGQ